MQSIISDIRDLRALEQATRKVRPEIVIHLAAQPLVRFSYANPVDTYAVNVLGTVHVLEAVRQTPGIKAVINVTTDKCYENREWVWGYRENEPMGGQDPYSSSKGCAELVSSAYRSSFFGGTGSNRHEAAVATVRSGNVIGGGDWSKDRLVPDILSAIEAGRPALVRSPHAVRPWQHVLDPLHGYLILAERLFEQGTSYAEAWNFGPSDEDAMPVGWIAGTLADLWGDGASWQIDDGKHPHEATFLKLDTAKARTRLDWRPVVGLKRALELTVDWTKAMRSGVDMHQHTLAQIRSYQAGLAG
jgi:CDP-glucose 4,6-dehydratase